MGVDRTVPPDGALRAAFERHFRVQMARRAAELEEVHRLRYQVYCLEHAFEDPGQHAGGIERDEFDAGSSHALVRHLNTNACAAVVRLVQARRLHGRLLPIEAHCAASLYPEAQARIAGLPRSRLAEISRLAVSRAFKRRLAEAETVSGVSDQAVYADAQRGFDPMRQRGFPHITVGLFSAIVQLSVESDVTHWLAVMEPTLLRLLRRFGIRFERIGHDVEYHGRRRPTLGVAADVVDGILAERPDIWDLVTMGGRYLPPRA
ncbi:MAG: PEP-CTERM/exosortase system-associated acyltransferase [Spiribacter salinus]|uniref:PEP-CTERM/exosortase system-associated acyltransferase n=1 Tax=Spiribacter salinus TaxID=1335746 RepID=A0A540VN73_9GAMM|nr:MAG: PEP-CTERM/exosortase system-associated acyltransferase [Spiribacter salinus]